MTPNLTNWILSHLIWVVGVGVALVLGHSYLQDHDALVKAQATITAAQVQIQTLQQGIDARDKATATQVAPIVRIIHDTQTVADAVRNLPAVVSQPLPVPIAVPSPNSDVVIPQPDVLPLFQQVADDKICRALLDTSTKDLTDTKSIVVQQTTEITALKAKPKFWSRVKSVAKAVGVGIGLGVLVGAKL